MRFFRPTDQLGSTRRPRSLREFRPYTSSGEPVGCLSSNHRKDSLQCQRSTLSVLCVSLKFPAKLWIKKKFYSRKQEMGRKHHHNDDNEERKTAKNFFFSFCFEKFCRSNRITRRTKKKENPTAGAASSCRKFNQILKISLLLFIFFFSGQTFRLSLHVKLRYTADSCGPQVMQAQEQLINMFMS